MLVFDWVCSLAIPLVYVLLGAIFCRRPSQRINFTAGWRSKAAMKNARTWAFANRYGGKCLFYLGLICGGITLAALLLLRPAPQAVKDGMTVVFVVLQCLALLPCYRKVERRIRALPPH